MEFFIEDDAYQNYIIERSVIDSIDQVQETIIGRENKFNKIKYYTGVLLIWLPLNIATTIVTGGISLLATFAIGLAIWTGESISMISIFNPNKKQKFFMNNSKIIQTILID